MIKKILPLIAGVMLHTILFAQVSKKTFAYAVKDSSTLYLDVYAKAGNDSVKKPCVLFVFGGAFVGGSRDDQHYIRYFNGLAASGITVFSISYRLGLKGVTNLSVTNTHPLRDAIDMAVEDVYDATNWILAHGDSLQIDSSRIVLCGSSSGAVTALHAEYGLCNQQAESKTLPYSFHYAGVIAFSGAILSNKGKPAYKTSPAPTLFFHGTEDKIVPYKSIRFFNKGLFGSSSLAEVYKKSGYAYYIYRAQGLGHEVSVVPMVTQIPLVIDFVNRYVLQQQHLQTDITVNDPSEKPMLTISAKALFKKLAGKAN